MGLVRAPGCCCCGPACRPAAIAAAAGAVAARRAAAAPIAGTGPILLLTLVGGLWGFGLRGLVLAPAAVVLALSAWDALTSLYIEPDQATDVHPPVGHA